MNPFDYVDVDAFLRAIGIGAAAGAILGLIVSGIRTKLPRDFRFRDVPFLTWIILGVMGGAAYFVWTLIA